ncbi:hypothetical protein V3W47_10755 [Deinococcus sp. YIM 134068]|uniref:hypothetical protein n=1 Tax=Deinococcus lichenicola TaxID=3118910 RepID=UPI002F949E1D
MLALTLTARALRRKLRTGEAEPYRVNVADVLPHVSPEQRPGAALRMALDPLRVEVVTPEPGERLPGLSCTAVTFGPRWWLTCPGCARRCAFLYWHGHRDVGRWRCRVCVGLKYTSSATHRTVQGDWEAVSAGPVSSWAAYRRASERQRRRWARLLRTLEG